jgi:hypothetical protein
MLTPGRLTSPNVPLGPIRNRAPKSARSRALLRKKERRIYRGVAREMLIYLVFLSL